MPRRPREVVPIQFMMSQAIVRKAQGHLLSIIRGNHLMEMESGLKSLRHRRSLNKMTQTIDSCIILNTRVWRKKSETLQRLRKRECTRFSISLR
jgi:hypothetical protein